MFPSSKIGSICSASPPLQDNAVTSSDPSVDEDKQSRIHDQVKLDKEFKKLEFKLHELIMSYKDCISWNGEPGKTNLGETEICTGGASPIFVPPSRLSPDVAKIVEKQIKKWLDNGTIVPADNKGSRWNARLLIVPKKQGL